MTAYEQIGVTPEILALLNGEWSTPCQVRATREPNGALSLAFRNYSPPVMTAEERRRDERIHGVGMYGADTPATPRGRARRAADQ
jgi:hypothetical protein